MKIELSQSDFVALVDESDFHLVVPFSWCRNSNGYAMTWDRFARRFVYMHRLILGAAKGQQIDHINRNKLDNRRANLRFTSQLENVLNTGLPASNRSGIKGVYRHSTNPKWIAQIKKAGRVRYLGSFDTLEEAATCRAEAFQKAFGELAWP